MYRDDQRYYDEVENEQVHSGTSGNDDRASKRLARVENMAKARAEQAAPAGGGTDMTFTSEMVTRQADNLAEAYDDLSNAYVVSMLRDYAAILHESESAKAAVTDELVLIALTEMYGEQFADISGKAKEIFRSHMQAALEAVAPMLASARAPEPISEHEALQSTVNAQQDTIGALKRKLVNAENERNALRQRIKSAPVAEDVLLGGKRVRLVIAEDGE